MTDDGPGGATAVPALVELAGAGFVIIGLALIWIPLAFIATGVVLVLVATSMERGAEARVRSGAR